MKKYYEMTPAERKAYIRKLLNKIQWTYTDKSIIARVEIND